MWRVSKHPAFNTLLALALLALLALLAGLQYRWTGEMSRADRERTRVSLEAALGRLAHDFDREITRVVATFRFDPGRRWSRGRGTTVEWIAQRLRSYREEAEFPDLVKGLFETRFDDGERAALLWRYDSALGDFEQVPWPTRFEDLRQRLNGRLREGRWRPLEVDIPALVVPSPLVRQGAPEAALGLRRFLIIELQRAVLFGELLPRLVERHLPVIGGGPPEFHLALFDRDGGELLYHLGALPTELTGDAEVGLLRSFTRDEVGRGGDRGARGPHPRGGEPRGHRGPAEFLMGHRGDGAWRLVATHAAGSLDAAVERVRRRNLVISFSILALLAGSVALLLDSTRRARRLARQQLEFVAGVTHELMTPLAALRSAGQNLADGVVTEPGQVARYGNLIDREGRRLGDMVGQVLELAGMWSGQRRLEREPVGVASLIDSAVGDLHGELEKHGFEVEVEITDPPPIHGDPGTLRRALDNLLANAVKYAAKGAWVGISAHAVGEDVEIAVADRGVGIPASDLPHIFEPFRRGRDMAASAIPGSGLGLSLVKSIAEDHGGSLTVESSPRGTTFRLRLPAVPTAERGHDAH